MRKTFTSLLFCSAGLFAADPSAVAIRNARVVTVSGPILNGGTVLISGGLIEAVGENVAVPPDAWVLDGTGLTVYPGLIDALSTWGIPELAPPPSTPAGSGSRGQTAPPQGRTSTVLTTLPAAPAARGPEDRPSTTSWLNAADMIQSTDRRIETFRSAGFTSAVTFPQRGIFAGQGAVINLAGDKPGQMVVASPVAQYISITRSADSFGGGFPGSLMGMIAYVRQLYLDAGHYKQVKAAYAANPRGMMRPDYDRALEGLLDSPRALLPASRAVEIERMIRFGAELKQPVILYGAHEAYRTADLLRKSNTATLVSLKWPERRRDADPEFIESLRILELRENAPGTPAALAKAGVKFALYSDNIPTPRELFRALKRAMDAGLSPNDALRALTLSPAEIFGVADRLGSIEKGKIANLVVVKGDLLQERPQVQYIFIDGAKYEPAPEIESPARQTESGGVQ